jgi:hypothetical protein
MLNKTSANDETAISCSLWKHQFLRQHDINKKSDDTGFQVLTQLYTWDCFNNIENSEFSDCLSTSFANGRNLLASD